MNDINAPVQRMFSWNKVETAVVLNPSTHPNLDRCRTGIPVGITFTSGEWIALWFETDKEVQEFFQTYRRHMLLDKPGVYVVNTD